MPDADAESLRAEANRLAAQLADLEGARSVILRMDTSGTITSANQFTHEFFGFDEGELVGRNVAGEPLYDSSTGGCCDCIEPTGVSANQGADATISWLYSLHVMHDVSVSRALAGTLPFIEKAVS